METTTNLYPSFPNLRSNLSPEDIDELVTLLGKYCRSKTLVRLRSILTYSPSLIENYGILNRLVKEDGRWTYIAGQSYPDEIRLVRNLVLGR